MSRLCIKNPSAIDVYKRQGAKELDLIIPRLEDKSIALRAMTGKPTSPLGLAAKAVLDISVEREACPMHLICV